MELDIALDEVTCEDWELTKRDWAPLTSPVLLSPYFMIPLTREAMLNNILGAGIAIGSTSLVPGKETPNTFRYNRD